MQHIQLSPVMKRNPRPRKYASDAERQAAFRARNVMVEFRAENKTADTLNKIADEIDVSRSDLVLSMVKFALTNHDWARFGLTHKTIPLYKGNPMGKDLPFKPTNTNLENEAKFLENYAKDSLNTWIVLGQTEKYSEIMDDVNKLRHAKKIKGLNNRSEYLTKYFEKVKKGDFYKGNPMATKKPSAAQLDARARFAEMARSGAFAKKRKTVLKKNPTGRNTGMVNWMVLKWKRANNTASGNPVFEFQLAHPITQNIYKGKTKPNAGFVYGLSSIYEGDHLMAQLEETPSGRVYMTDAKQTRHTNPRKKSVGQKISQLEHEGYPHKQSIAIALSEQRRGKVKRNPSGEIGAYEITRNFKVLGIFKTKADAIKAAQGISDATGKTIAVKPVQVLAGHFDR